MAQTPEIIKPVGFRTKVFLWNKFKAKVYESNLDVSTVMTKMIELFVENEEFRRIVIQAINEG